MSLSRHGRPKLSRGGWRTALRFSRLTCWALTTLAVPALAQDANRGNATPTKELTQFANVSMAATAATSESATHEAWPQGNSATAAADGPGLSDPGPAIDTAKKDVKGSLPKSRSERHLGSKKNLPAAHEHRFVPAEVLVALPSDLSDQSVDSLARKHRLTRLESQQITLTGMTIHRWRIPDKRSVPDVIRVLKKDASIRAAQPNNEFALQ